MDTSVRTLRKIFARWFFANLIIDKTPDYTDKEYQKEQYSLSSYSGRAREIAYWLKKHPTITNIVVIDDYDNGLSKGFPECFVKVNPDKRLTDGDVEKAKKILNK